MVLNVARTRDFILVAGRAIAAEAEHRSVDACRCLLVPGRMLIAGKRFSERRFDGGHGTGGRFRTRLGGLNGGLVFLVTTPPAFNLWTSASTSDRFP
jgi:hypothetical protein